MSEMPPEDAALSQEPDENVETPAPRPMAGLSLTEIAADFPAHYFDDELYRRRYPAAAERMAARVTWHVVDDYLRFGAAEGLNPCAWFEEAWYLRSRPDARAAVEAGEAISGLHFFLTVGRFRGDDPGPRFSDKRYLAAHPGVAAVVNMARARRLKGDLVSGLDHWLLYGLEEDRALGLGSIGGKPLVLNLG